MGQFHKLYNLDKREFVHAHRLDNGLKLMEQCGFEASTATALWLLLANSNGRGLGDAKPHPWVGRWAGDRILVQGDYAQPGDPAYLPERDLATFSDISEPVRNMLENEFGQPIRDLISEARREL